MQDAVVDDAAVEDAADQSAANPPTVERRKVTRRAVGSNAVVGRRESKTEEPTIELKRRNGVVESILVTCCCGHKIEIECGYTEQQT